MINTYYQVPEVYYKESRDFQLLGRIYDIIFNYLKTNIDTIYHNPLDKSTDKNLLDLLSCTLGFESRHNYDINQLYAICSSFSKIIRNKGTLYAIEITINALLNSQGIDKVPEILIEESNPYLINIFIPTALVDTTLLEDILDYIMPVGMSYSIIKSINIKSANEDIYVTKSGLNASSFDVTIKSTTSESEQYGQDTADPINYLGKYTGEEDYDNLLGPGTIDNSTVTIIKDNNEGE